jgi:peptide/nickel transport system substrate-binding protein
VVVGLMADVSTFNEYQSTGEVMETAVIDLLFPSLAVEQPDYEQHPPSFVPRLAERWESSADGKELTFHLRRDARWSDGTPVTAEDVRFTFQVQKSEDVGSPGLEMKDAIKEVEVLDPATVRFHFSHAYPYQLMDANDGHVVPAHVWGKVPFADWQTTDFSGRLVTCGPFRLAGRTAQQTITLERDPTYWGRPRPHLDRLVLRVIPDVTGQVNQLLSGQLDVVPVLPPQEAERVRASATARLVDMPSRLWGFLAWNNRKAQFSDPRVRRALGEAINRLALVDTVYLGHARLAVGPVLSSFWAFDKNLEPLPFDPAAAARLLDEAGFAATGPGGCRQKSGKPLAFDLLYPAGNTIRAQAAVLIQADLARVGVTARPVAVEFAALQTRLESGLFEAALHAWEEPTKVDLTSCWVTPGKGGGSSNFFGYSNAEVDRLVRAARDESDLARARPLLDRAQELIAADAPVTFLYEARQLVGLSRRLEGAEPSPASVFFTVESWRLTPR